MNAPITHRHSKNDVKLTTFSRYTKKGGRALSLSRLSLASDSCLII